MLRRPCRCLQETKCKVSRVPSVGKCCQVCLDSSRCNAFTYSSETRECLLRTFDDEILLKSAEPQVGGEGHSLSWAGLLSSNAVRARHDLFRAAEVRDGWKGRRSLVVITKYL